MAPKVNTSRLYSDIVTGRGAATQVFSTFELCDLIVQNLSVFDVIRVSGLNLVTKAVVAESTKIQEKLFFRATSDKELYGRCDDQTHENCGTHKAELHGATFASFTVSNPTGVTFGEIVDRLHFELGQVKAVTNGYTGANLIFEDGLPVVLPVVKEKVEELGLITSHDRIYIKPYGEPHGDLRI
ncbi:hypothetical protein LTR10_015014 [Elasticomyces elasticus]|nr:hypothetical protein LTR10_015014 [Elasticomyces elasticus]KAK4964590.1 hypothetical protein LTR42_012888 [Elasticomyces elasticus]